MGKEQTEILALGLLSETNPESKIQNRKWVALVALIVTFAMCGTMAQAQPKNFPRIGVLLSGSRSPVWSEAFREALRELGYVEGKNITIEYRNAEGRNERQAKIANELVAMKVDVLVSGGGNDVTQALMSQTKTIPIVMTAGSNAVSRGLISSLPGREATSPG